MTYYIYIYILNFKNLQYKFLYNKKLLKNILIKLLFLTGPKLYPHVNQLRLNYSHICSYQKIEKTFNYKRERDDRILKFAFD